MKKIILSLTAAILFFLSIPFLPVFSGKKELIEIKEGMSGYAAAKKVSSQIAPCGERLFTFSIVLASSMYGSAKPGIYRFGRTSAFASMRSVCRGDCVTITVSEGMTAVQTAALILRTLHLPADDPAVTALEKNPSLYEGELFPAVYPVKTMKAEDLFAEMRGKYKAAASKYHFTRRDLILASIVQKETRYPFEMKRCAGVLANRLKTGMKLECDTVLMYVVGNQRISKELIKKDSPYNTFLYKGLPPSPICSPGIDALKAAADPETNDYLYFVAKKDGHLYFSKNIHEHFKAVEFYMLGRPNGFKPRAE